MASNDLTMADAPVHRADRRMAASPPPTQSKRDKRRQLLTERIATLSEKQTKGQDQIYREKLQKIQIDTNLVMRVDPYVDRPLDDFEKDQERLRQINGDTDTPRTLLEMAGPKFASWMERVQDLVEQRDFSLTKYKVRFTDILPHQFGTFPLTRTYSSTTKRRCLNTTVSTPTN